MYRGKIPLSACHRPTNILYSHAPYIAPLVVCRLCLYVHALLLLFTGEGTLYNVNYYIHRSTSSKTKVTLRSRQIILMKLLGATQKR